MMNIEQALDTLQAPNQIRADIEHLKKIPMDTTLKSSQISRVETIMELTNWLITVNKEIIKPGLKEENKRIESQHTASKAEMDARRKGDEFTRGVATALITLNSTENLHEQNVDCWNACRVIIDFVERQRLGLKPGEYPIDEKGNIIADKDGLLTPGLGPVHGSPSLRQSPATTGTRDADYLNDPSQAEFPLHRTAIPGHSTMKTKIPLREGGDGITRYCPICGSALKIVNPPNPMYANGACPNPKCKAYGRPPDSN